MKLTRPSTLRACGVPRQAAPHPEHLRTPEARRKAVPATRFADCPRLRRKLAERSSRVDGILVVVQAVRGDPAKSRRDGMKPVSHDVYPTALPTIVGFSYATTYELTYVWNLAQCPSSRDGDLAAGADERSLLVCIR